MLTVSKSNAVALVFFFLLAGGAAGQRPSQTAKAPVAIDQATLKPMEGQVVYYRSRLFGDLQPFAICVTDLSNEPKPLLVDLNPATFSNVERAAKNCEEICQISKSHGLSCVAVRLCGRGDGTVFQGYGEMDVYEAVAAVRKMLPIGRTPAIANVDGGGRDRWPHAYSALLAGGGIRGGQVYGRTDAVAGAVADLPIRPDDLSATLYEALGIPADTILHDSRGRPHRITDGTPVRALLA